jgi:hypothetical protein
MRTNQRSPVYNRSCFHHNHLFRGGQRLRVLQDFRERRAALVDQGRRRGRWGRSLPRDHQRLLARLALQVQAIQWGRPVLELLERLEIPHLDWGFLARLDR